MNTGLLFTLLWSTCCIFAVIPLFQQSRTLGEEKQAQQKGGTELPGACRNKTLTGKKLVQSEEECRNNRDSRSTMLQ